MTVAITRKEPGAVELRREAARCRDARATRRMLAPALVLEGRSREEATRAGGMDRRTVRDWAHRHDAGGRSTPSATAAAPDRARGPRPGERPGWRRSQS